jgi:hypothetical protein
MKDLKLENELEKAIFMRMVGKRYNVGKQELKLTCEKFTNRIENRKYLVYTLELLLSETRRLSKESDKYLIDETTKEKVSNKERVIDFIV